VIQNYSVCTECRSGMKHILLGVSTDKFHCLATCPSGYTPHASDANRCELTTEKVAEFDFNVPVTTYANL
jgi:hypothetical protein